MSGVLGCVAASPRAVGMECVEAVPATETLLVSQECNVIDAVVSKMMRVAIPELSALVKDVPLLKNEAERTHEIDRVAENVRGLWKESGVESLHSDKMCPAHISTVLVMDTVPVHKTRFENLVVPNGLSFTSGMRSSMIKLIVSNILRSPFTQARLRVVCQNSCSESECDSDRSSGIDSMNSDSEEEDSHNSDDSDLFDECSDDMDAVAVSTNQ